MINMKQVDISVFTQFIPDWFALEGVVSGVLNFGGRPNKTKFDFDLSIDESVFEGSKWCYSARVFVQFWHRYNVKRTGLYVR
jgi:hypothetical protein